MPNLNNFSMKRRNIVKSPNAVLTPPLKTTHASEIVGPVFGDNGNITLNSSNITINSSVTCINASSYVEINADTIINGSLVLAGPLTATNISSGQYVPILYLGENSVWSLDDSKVRGSYIRHDKVIFVNVSINFRGTFKCGEDADCTVCGTLPMLEFSDVEGGYGIVTLRPDYCSSEVSHPEGYGNVVVDTMAESEYGIDSFVARPMIPFVLTDCDDDTTYTMSCSFTYFIN